MNKAPRPVLDLVGVREGVLDTFGRSDYVILDIFSGRTWQVAPELIENPVEQGGAICVD
jgi:hypothetical protein